jgi:hypothetical protein
MPSSQSLLLRALADAFGIGSVAASPLEATPSAWLKCSQCKTTLIKCSQFYQSRDE